MVSDPLRRRSVGAPAARSLLLTILGEYVLPRDEPVWQETLVAALGELDVSVQAARQALARSTRDGWLTGERHGRRTRLALTPGTRMLLRSGADRIYGFGADEPWAGEWLLVVLRVPEKQRDVRHALRTQLAWAGLGSLGGGLWITPRVDREEEITAIVTGEARADVISFCGRLGRETDGRELARNAWDLDGVAGAYHDFLTAFGQADATTPKAAFARQTMLVHAWRKFPFLDPGLPAELLPGQWPRNRAHDLFRACHESWRAAATERFESLERDVGRGAPSADALTAGR
jgi:phenylacetic acid degradation operon negative regulatory protein